MFVKLFTLARSTFFEVIRQPLYGVLLLLTAGLMILNVSLAAFTMEDDDKLLLDLGLSTLLLSGLFLASFSAAGVLGREIENKTVLTVVSKPVSRPLLILGKYLGLAAALATAYYLGFLAFVLCVRHGVMEYASDPWDAPVLTLGFGSVLAAVGVAAFCNYFYGRHFAATAIGLTVPLLTAAVLAVGKFDEHWNPIPFGSNFVGGQIVIAGYLVMLVVLFTAAVALAASTRLGQTMTLLVCTGVLMVGIVADYAFGQHAETSRLAALAYTFIPNIGPFWVIDGLVAAVEETSVPLRYVGYVTGYAVLEIVAVLALAVALFQRRELG